MIGKMYRPLKILSIPDRRGFTIYNKYKSNFGGIYKFEQDIYLDYDSKTETENIVIEFKNLDLPVMINSKKDRTYKKTKDKILINRKKWKIKTLRKMNRPVKISSSSSLELTIPILSSKDENENDYLELIIIPNIIDGKEYLIIEANSKTPVLISSKSGVNQQN